MMAIDAQRASHETPRCGNVWHFNKVGAALMLQPVLDATIAHLQLEALVGRYEAAVQAHDAAVKQNHLACPARHGLMSQPQPSTDLGCGGRDTQHRQGPRPLRPWRANDQRQHDPHCLITSSQPLSYNERCLCPIRIAKLYKVELRGLT